MSAIDKVVDRLLRVKQTRPNNFIAGCPCCQSKNGRPISVRETDQGQILIFAFCGCRTEDLLAAIGLKLADLFDKPLAHTLPPIRGGLSARELLELVSHEILVGCELASVATQRQLTVDELSRLERATARLLKARTLANVSR